MKLSPSKLRAWSISVRWRDRQCVICKTRSDLEAHHIYDKSTYPEMAYDLSNGISLCGSGNSCHSAFHNRFMGGTGRTCTVQDWIRFLAFMAWAENLKAPEKKQ